jgi:RNA polymerase sigma factor (sigma-70 family)
MASRQDFQAMAIPHLGAAHALARWLMKDASEAEDVVQEAYLRAFRAIETLTGADIKPWLLAIVRNSAYRRLAIRRRRSKVVSIDEAFRFDDEGEPGLDRIPDGAPNAEEQMLANADRSLAVEALGMLTPIYREVLVLREIEELDYRQIAEVVGIPVGTVMSRISRARAELRENFMKLSRKLAQ